MTQKTRTCTTALVLLVLASRLCAAELLADRELALKVTAPTIVGALIQFSQQTGLQLVYPSDDTIGLAAPKLEGTYTPKAALKYLLEDSGLTFEFVNERTILVTRTTLDESRKPAHPTPTVAR